MQKIPTLFERDPDDRRHVLPIVNPAAAWVLDGEGIATRKFDGTCIMCDDDGAWWARREVRPGKQPPPNFQPIEHDDVTGKTVGWEPVEQSPFAKFHAEAVAIYGLPWNPGTYELIGPKINGNPDGSARHWLVAHGAWIFDDVPRDFEGLRHWLLEHDEFEGIVWHHPDGRMAKLKRRDFA